MKKCILCKQVKIVSSFSKDISKKDRLQSSCKKCKQKSSNKYYLKNKKKVREKANFYRNETREMIRKIKESTPCTDCGKKYRYFAMHFDHIRDKNFNVAWGFTSRSRKKVFDEIKKCEVVCAVCHTYRTHNRNLKRRGLV